MGETLHGLAKRAMTIRATGPGEVSVKGRAQTQLRYRTVRVRTGRRRDHLAVGRDATSLIIKRSRVRKAQKAESCPGRSAPMQAEDVTNQALGCVSDRAGRLVLPRCNGYGLLG